MAQLMRSKHLAGLFHHAVSRSAYFPHSVWTMRKIRPCYNSCQWLGLKSSGNILFGVSGQRWTSGVAKIKPGRPQKISKGHWKKKKKKNSDISQKIHTDLLKVLDKRAVQLVFSKEANQLHRTLVTNFSFIDFPLQGLPDTLPVQALEDAQVARNHMNSVPVSEVHVDSVCEPDTETSRTLENEWQEQFVSFDQQLQNVHTSGQGFSVQDSGLNVSGAAERRKPALSGESLSSQPVSDGLHEMSSHSFEKLVSSTLKSLSSSAKSEPFHKQFVTQQSSIEPRHSELESPSGPTAGQQSSSKAAQSGVANSPVKSQPGKTTKPSSVSVNANILNTKKKKTPAQKRRAVTPVTADADMTVPFVDSLEVEVEGEKEAVDELEDLQLQKSMSKVELQRLRKARSERDKFQSNPAKFNHIFNQELLAYVDACCFAGLESIAHNMVKMNHHSRLSDNKMFPGMRRIEDINIYNKIIHAWAKKCQMAQIKDLMRLMKEDDLRPNLQTFAAVWESLGRQHNMDLDVGNSVLQEMDKEGLDIKDIFNMSVFCQDQQQAIRAVDPTYTPSAPPQPAPPSGPLVDSLTSVPDHQVEKNPYADILPVDDTHRLLETQMQRELRTTVSVKSIIRQTPPSRRVLEYRKNLTNLKEEWRGQLTKAFERKLRYMARKAKMEYGMTLYPYLKVLQPQDYVQCMMQEVEELATTSESFSPNKSYLWRRLSGRVYNKFVMTEKVRNKVPKKVNNLYQQYMNSFFSSDLDLSSHRELWQSLMVSSGEGPALDTPEKIWPSHVFLALGKLLYELIVYDLKVDTNMLKTSTPSRNMVPAFYTIYRSYSYQVVEEIKPHPMVMKVYQGSELNELSFNSSFLPMLVPPLPWVSRTLGGYLLSAVRLVRIPMQAQAQREKLEQTANTQLSTVLDAINALSACAWVINKPVLDIIIDIFNNNGDSSLDIPPPASQCPSPSPITQEMTAQEKSAAHRQRQKLRAQKAEMYSLWCQELYKLSIANKFRDEVFWFPHNLDFRGRTYPCPPHFNHLGSDITRSILMFAKGKPLGPQGLDWMKIHLINLTGFKKRSPNRDRLAYANQMMDDILDSADNPLTGNMWWKKSDEPWQTLACCMEIAKAIRSPDPEQYVCHLPIHQDGSCNGLQHYAALGRDLAGAQSVNLWPYDCPQDVYSDVCELVERERQKDAAEGVEIAQQLEGFVRRKVIKQTVMTTVYGVTRYGAKAQILRQLKDIPEFPQAKAWAGSLYLTEKTFQCLNEMFSATKDIQDWLTLSAQLIATVCQRPVEWMTPIGLTVVQPYHKPLSMLRYGVSTNDHWNCFEKPNAMKQKNAFPPNFIHSLDSTHMMLTALYCLRSGITFVSVHDCFWTHACDVEIMNKVCREQFVALHKQPLLEDLSRQLISTYIPGSHSSEEAVDAPVVKAQQFLHNVLANVPVRGDFDLDKVSESTYFFS
ncbi:DNA-directed RNA polymerase, mitochondrial-like [Babylonia areolata]|uniref:DNA-directed RNA polymerase, mitochondrial-like n=1 Tax=Babylonia areolata TaxID=304850 RepID=UPI003FD3F318